MTDTPGHSVNRRDVEHENVITSQYPSFFWASLMACILLIKIIFLMYDNQPFFVLGDSAVYVRSAITNQVPSDRSFAYGYIFIKSIVDVFGSLQSVILVQALLSSILAFLTAIMLVALFRAPFWIAALGAVLYTIEPISLLHERMMLTEAVATFAFVCLLISGVFYLYRPRWVLLFLMVFMLFVVMAMRVSLLPASGWVLVFVSALARDKLPEGSLIRQDFFSRERFARLLVACSLTFSCHVVYTQWYHYVTGQPAGYNSASGLFLLAAWAPLVTSNDFPEVSIGEQILSHLTVPLGNRFNRPAQRFSQGGLIDRLSNLNGGEDQANSMASKIADRILRRTPWGIIKLAKATYLDFWNMDYLDATLLVAEGLSEVDDDLVEYFRDVHGEDITGHHKMLTISKIWYRNAKPWYMIVLLTPLILIIAFLLNPRRRSEVGLFFVVSVALVAIVTVPVTEPIVRYLHPLAWLCLISLMLLLIDLCHQIAQKRMTVGILFGL